MDESCAMRSLWIAALLFWMLYPAIAQEATDTPSNQLIVRDQLSTDGLLWIDKITLQAAGWVAVYADVNRTPGPLVGLAAIPAGESERVGVWVDVPRATRLLHVMLYADNAELGRFDYLIGTGADQPILQDGSPISETIEFTALQAYEQQVVGDTVAVAGVVVQRAGWLVIYADAGGQQGAVLGRVALVAGTNPNMLISFPLDTVTEQLHAVLHTDDGQNGVFEFGRVENTDMPLLIDEQPATTTFKINPNPVILKADGSPINVPSGILPFLSAATQSFDLAAPALLLESLSVGGGWLKVYVDGGQHPGLLLTSYPLANGTTRGQSIPLSGRVLIANTPEEAMPVVWPRLHVDDHTPRVDEYLIVPEADLPVIVNGVQLTFPLSLGDSTSEGR